MRKHLMMFILCGLLIALTGCERGEQNASSTTDGTTRQPTTPPTTQPTDRGEPSAPATQPSADNDDDRGLNWSPPDNPREARFLDFAAPKPATWVEHPPRDPNMRLANYTVPGRDGADAAEIVVFHFPGNQSNVAMNIQFYQQMFRIDPDTPQPPEPIIDEFEVDGMPVTFVEFHGAYKERGLAFYKPDHIMLVAIYETPNHGLVYLRMVGEEPTIEAARDEFLAMVRGLRQLEDQDGDDSA